VTPQRRRSLIVGSLIGLVAAVVIALLLTGGNSGGTVLDEPGGSPEPTLGPGRDVTGQMLPDGTFTLLGGGSARFADYRGKPLVVNVWSSTCAPCVKEMPAMEQVHQAEGDAVAFLGVNPQDRAETAQRFAGKTGVTYDLALDPAGDLTAHMGVAFLPTTFLVGPDGTVRHVERGELTATELTTLIAEKLRA